MRILVTGAAGFIGHHLLLGLLNKEDANLNEITALDRLPFHFNDRRVHYVTGDLNDNRALMEGCNDIQAVYHLAGYTGQAKDRREIQAMKIANVDGTARLLESLDRFRIRRFVYMSTAAVYGEIILPVVAENTKVSPATTYAGTKYQAEILVREFCIHNQIPFVILRATSVFGEHHPRRHLLGLAQAIKKGYFFFIGDDQSYVNYVYIEDMIYALLRAPGNVTEAESLYIVNTPTVLHDFVSYVAAALAIEMKYKNIPIEIGRFLAMSGSYMSKLTRRQMPIDMDKFHQLTNATIFSSAKLRTALPGFPIVGVEKGIISTITHYLSQGWL